METELYERISNLGIATGCLLAASGSISDFARYVRFLELEEMEEVLQMLAAGLSKATEIIADENMNQTLEAS